METALANYIRQSYFGNINGVNKRPTGPYQLHQVTTELQLEISHISMRILQIELQTLRGIMIFFNQGYMELFS